MNVTRHINLRLLVRLGSMVGVAPYHWHGGAYHPSAGWRAYSALLFIVLASLKVVTLWKLWNGMNVIPRTEQLVIHIQVFLWISSLYIFILGAIFCMHRGLQNLLNAQLNFTSSAVKEVAFLLTGWIFVISTSIQAFMSSSPTPFHSLIIKVATSSYFVLAFAILPTSVVLFIHLIRRVQERYKKINDTMALFIEDKNLSRSLSMMDHMLILRSRHRATSELLEQLCYCFAPHLVLMLMHNMCSVVVILNSLLPKVLMRNLRWSDLVSALVLFQTVLPSVWILTSCQRVSNEGNRTNETARLLFEKNDLEVDVKRIIRLQSMWSGPRVEVTLFGGIILDNKLLVSTVSTVATYLIVLLQFSSPEIRGPT